MRDYNIDRKKVSSEEISSFKDFKSILQKNAQTTQDLSKIKASGSLKNIYWIIGGITSSLAVFVYFLLGGETKEVVLPDLVERMEIVESPPINWRTIIRTPKNSIEKEIGVNVISANRVDFIRFGNSSEVLSLLSNIQNSDANFVSESLVFKVESDEDIVLSNTNELFKLSDEGRWNKVEYVPIEIPYIEKPVLWKKGELAIRMNFQNFEGPASEFENVFWKPINLMDLDESFFNTDWEDASIQKTSVKGVYNLVFKLGNLEKSFNGYPALPKSDYKKAMKDYNSKIFNSQERLKNAPKKYNVSSGIFTIK
jgi:hypothetical protein